MLIQSGYDAIDSIPTAVSDVPRQEFAHSQLLVVQGESVQQFAVFASQVAGRRG